jgi:Zn-dependent protease with chaperone function
MSIAARYFDGRSARAHRVQVAALDGSWRIEGEQLLRIVSFAGAQVEERLGSMPARLSFGDGACCEFDAVDEFERLLAEIGFRRSRVERWQLSGGIALACVLAVVAIMFASLRWGLPWAANNLAQHLPQSLRISISDSALMALDRGALQPSSLGEERQAQARAALRRVGESCITCRLEFRAAPRLGPNAFALPDGRIVVFDSLVLLSDDNDDLSAVLAHELGHVYEDHGLRQVIQQSAVAALAAAWFGDASTLLLTAPAALIQLRYSRAFEDQADDFAVQRLKAAGISPEHLAGMLERLEAAHGTVAATAPSKHPSGALDDYFSSHPDTQERARRIRGQR